MKSFLKYKPKDSAEGFKLRDICKVPIFKLIAPVVDSSQLELAELSKQCEKLVVLNLKMLISASNPDLEGSLQSLDGIFHVDQSDPEATGKTTNLLQDLIKINSERRSYGFRKARSFAAPDQATINSSAAASLGSIDLWELTNAGFYLTAKRCKQLQSEQRVRAQANSELRALEKVFQLLDRARTDKDVVKL